MSAAPDDEIAIRIAAAIRAHRKSRGWTVNHLAGLVGMARPLVSRAESGKHLLRVDVILRFCRAFEIAPSRFFECLDEGHTPLRARLEALLEKWKVDRASYPIGTEEEALYAHAAVSLCERELRSAMDGDRPTLEVS